MDKNFEKAEKLKEKSKYKEALKYYRMALKAAATDEDSLACHMALGDMLRMTGGFQKATEHYAKAVELAPRGSDIKHDANVGLALAERGLGHWRKAVKAIEKSLAYYIKKDDPEGVAFSTWALAGALRIGGLIPEAVNAFDQARQLFDALRFEPGRGYCLCGLGGTTRVMGLPARSLGYYQKANKLFGEMGDTFGTAYSHCGIGNALRMRGDFEGALAEFKKATSLYRRIGDIVSYSYTLWSQGKTYAMLADHKKAEKFYRESLKHFTHTGDQRGVVYAKLGLAELLIIKGSVGPARKMLLAARETAAKYEFGIELAHVDATLSTFEGRVDNSAYKALGVKLKFKALPFNIP